MIEQFKATMNLFGYTWFEVYHNSWHGLLFLKVKEACRDAGGWPALWQVCKMLDIGWGCGGTFYHQIKRDSLPIGVYELGKPTISS